MPDGAQLVAKRVINKLGGARAVSLMLGVSVQAVYKWLLPISQGGAGGLIPARRQIELMVAAAQRGIKLTPEDFFPKAPNDGNEIQSSTQGSADDGRDRI